MANPLPSPDEAAARLAAQTERYLVLLNEMIDITADLARGIKVQAQTKPAAELAVPLDHLVRTIRRTMALAQKYAEPPKLPTVKRPPVERQFSHERITRDVEDAIQRRAETDREARSLRSELRERIDSPDMELEIDHRPTELIITDLLRDLGLAHVPGTHPWARRTPKDIAELKRRAALSAGTARLTAAPTGPATGPPAP